jgi:hypothetical protein
MAKGPGLLRCARNDVQSFTEARSADKPAEGRLIFSPRPIYLRFAKSEPAGFWYRRSPNSGTIASR